MENARLLKRYRPYGTSASVLSTLIYRLLVLDSGLRHLFDLGPNCGMVTLLTAILSVIMILCSLAGSSTVASNEKVFRRLQEEAEKKIPRRKSVAGMRPGYNCIHKHLRQTDVFQEKTKKMLCKERLELEILNSRIGCIGNLLSPQTQSDWRRDGSPRTYHRPINGTVTDGPATETS